MSKVPEASTLEPPQGGDAANSRAPRLTRRHRALNEFECCGIGAFRVI